MTVAVERIGSISEPKSEESLYRGETRLPEDLRDWVNEATLIQLISRAVQEIKEGEDPKALPGFWDLLLGLLTYSYATGTYLSSEIESRLLERPGIADRCAATFGNSPPEQIIRRFRRIHRASLKQCLVHVFGAAWEMVSSPDREYCGNYRIRSSPTANFAPAHETPDFDTAAEERIGHAVLLDCITSDF